jgi:hypothetical protein
VLEAAEGAEIAETRAGEGREGRSSAPVVLFAIAALGSATLLLALGWELTFLLDEWTFLIHRREFELDSLFAAHNEHIVVLPVAIYKSLLAVFGMESALPFRVVSTAMFILATALLFVWLRRRVGGWLALAGAVLVLFLGAAWEDLLWPFQIGFFGSMACGLGALLALERSDRPRDVIACVLLTVGIGFSTLTLPFVAGALVAIVIGRAPVSRLFVVAVPAVVFALWWLGWGREADTAISAANIATAPQFVIDGFAASLSSLLGLATPSGSAAISALDWGRPLLVLGVALAAWRLWRLGGVPRWLWVVGAIALSFWLLAAINEKEGRDAAASRYMYIGGVFCLMIAAELLRGVRLRGAPALAIVFVLVGAAVLSNVYFLDQSAKSYRATSDLISADLAAVEIARDHVQPNLILTEEIAETGYVHVYAQEYLSAADAYGSTADTEAELAEAPEPARRAADKVLATALGLTFTTVADPPAATGTAPQPVTGSAAEVEGACAEVELGPDSPPAILELAPGDAVVRGQPGAALELRLARFATETFAIPAGEINGRDAAVLAIPADRSSRPWRLSVAGRGSLTVCGAA